MRDYELEVQHITDLLRIMTGEINGHSEGRIHGLDTLF